MSIYLCKYWYTLESDNECNILLPVKSFRLRDDPVHYYSSRECGTPMLSCTGPVSLTPCPWWSGLNHTVEVLMSFSQWNGEKALILPIKTTLVNGLVSSCLETQFVAVCRNLHMKCALVFELSIQIHVYNHQ